MRYVNHLGDEYDFDAAGIYSHRNSIRDYEWDISTLGGAVSSTNRKEADVSIGVHFAMEAEACRKAKDALCEVLDVDAEAGKLGRLYDGDWYVSCIVRSTAKSLWWYGDGAAKFTVAFFAPEHLWVREHVRSFYPLTAGGDSYLDYPHDYPYDYRLSLSNQRVENPGFLPAPFKLTIYGPSTHPRIVIGGNVHEVETVLEAGDILTVDGLRKTIAIKKSDGTEHNAFSLRRGVQRTGSGSYVFEPLRAGLSEVYWDGSYGFDMTIYEQRSEMRW